MEKRDAIQLLKAIRSAQDGHGDLFSAKFEPTPEEVKIIEKAANCVEMAANIDLVTGIELTNIYRRAYP